MPYAYTQNMSCIGPINSQEDLIGFTLTILRSLALANDLDSIPELRYRIALLTNLVVSRA
jgi:hypothetical protein